MRITMDRDPAEFVIRCILSGLVGGIALGICTIIASGLQGLPLWSPVALYRTNFLGFARHPLIATSLWQAVVTGLTWDAMLGMAFGALFALLMNTILGPKVPTQRGLAAIGAAYGLVIWIVVSIAHLPLNLPPPDRVMIWGIAVGYVIAGAITGALAAITGG